MAIVGRNDGELLVLEVATLLQNVDDSQRNLRLPAIELGFLCDVGQLALGTLYRHERDGYIGAANYIQYEILHCSRTEARGSHPARVDLPL